MLKTDKKRKNLEVNREQGFITMIIIMILIMAGVIFLAYKRVSGA